MFLLSYVLSSILAEKSCSYANCMFGVMRSPLLSSVRKILIFSFFVGYKIEKSFLHFHNFPTVLTRVIKL